MSTSPEKKAASKKAVTKTAAKKTASKRSASSAAKKTAAKKKTLSKKAAAELQERAMALLERLKQAIPAPECELDFENPWQLLIATILSAQSTDKMVNRVTPTLFARFPTPEALALASQEEVEALVRQTGFFRNKAKAIRGASQLIVSDHGGEVPRSLEALTALPGVARKTANVVLGTAFRIPSGVTIDTHAGRVSRRLALTTLNDPVKVEQALCDLFPREEWIDLGHRFVLHGRYICLARTPRCAECVLNELCPSALEAPAEDTAARADLERRTVESRGEL